MDAIMEFTSAKSSYADAIDAARRGHSPNATDVQQMYSALADVLIPTLQARVTAAPTTADGQGNVLAVYERIRPLMVRYFGLHDFGIRDIGGPDPQRFVSVVNQLDILLQRRAAYISDNEQLRKSLAASASRLTELQAQHRTLLAAIKGDASLTEADVENERAQTATLRQGEHRKLAELEELRTASATANSQASALAIESTKLAADTELVNRIVGNSTPAQYVASHQQLIDAVGMAETQRNAALADVQELRKRLNAAQELERNVTRWRRDLQAVKYATERAEDATAATLDTQREADRLEVTVRAARDAITQLRDELVEASADLKRASTDSDNLADRLQEHFRSRQYEKDAHQQRLEKQRSMARDLADKIERVALDNQHKQQHLDGPIAELRKAVVTLDSTLARLEADATALAQI